MLSLTCTYNRQGYTKASLCILKQCHGYSTGPKQENIPCSIYKKTFPALYRSNVPSLICNRNNLIKVHYYSDAFVYACELNVQWKVQIGENKVNSTSTLKLWKKNVHGETHHERLQRVTLLSDLLATTIYITVQCHHWQYDTNTNHMKQYKSPTTRLFWCTWTVCKILISVVSIDAANINKFPTKTKK